MFHREWNIYETPGATKGEMQAAYICKKTYVYAIPACGHALPGKVNAFSEKSVRVSGKGVRVSGCSGTFSECINMQVWKGGIAADGTEGIIMLLLALGCTRGAT